MSRASLRDDVGKLVYHRVGDIEAEIAEKRELIPARFYDNSRLVTESNEAPVIVMRGFAEKRSTLFTLARLARMGIPAIAPMIDLGDIPKGLNDQQIRDYLEVMSGPAPYELLAEIHRRLKPDAPFVTLSNSLGGLLVAQAIAIDHEMGSNLIGDSALINPLGQTAIGGNVESSAHAFLWRFIKSTALVTPPWRRGIQQAGPEFTQEFISALRRKTLGPMMEHANTLDLAPAIAEHSINNRVAIVSGEKDTLFRPAEIMHRQSELGTRFDVVRVEKDTLTLDEDKRLTDDGLTVYVVEDGRHDNQAFRRGQRLLVLGAQALKLVA